MTQMPDIHKELTTRLGPGSLTPQATMDGVSTFWLPAAQLRDALKYLKNDAPRPFRMLYDLWGIDERARRQRPGQPAGDFTVAYQLTSLDRNADVRLKVALAGEKPSLPSIADLWANADWYEREVYDMLGIGFAGHPRLRRILMPPWWQGHPLRKEHPCRATEMGPFRMPAERQAEMIHQMQFRPEDYGMKSHGDEFDFMFLNIGPHHPGTHGVLRLVLQLDGQEIHDMACDIGFHHRAAEKMGERQTWHTYIPYTDRVDYLSGVINNLAYLLSVEKLAGIVIPPRAMVIRIMMSELYRISNHLVYYGTFSQDLGQMSPVFHMFTDRERVMEMSEAVTGARMHPGWFRIGGVAADLPEGWDTMMRELLDYLPKKIDEYDRTVLKNRMVISRTKGIGAISKDEAVEWGATGPMLRSTGLEWDLRKKRPYAGYDQFDFDVPVGKCGDCYDRMVVHVEEMRQSLRIMRQCLDNMPAGDYKARHPLTTPPIKDRTMKDIETLINHFLGVSWGPVMPAGEAGVPIEGTKGNTTYSLISDGTTTAYRTRIRTPSFPHMQMIPAMSRGMMIPDLIALLGSIDFVMSDVDR